MGKYKFAGLADVEGAMDALDAQVRWLGTIQGVVDAFADLPSPVGMRTGTIYIVRLDTPGHDNGFYVIQSAAWVFLDGLSFQDSDEVPNESGVAGASVTAALDALAGCTTWPLTATDYLDMATYNIRNIGQARFTAAATEYVSSDGAGLLNLHAATQVRVNSNLDMTDNPIEKAEYVEFQEITTPGTTANYGKAYTKSDNKMYFQDGAGAEHEIAFVGGAAFLPLAGGVMSGDIDMNGVAKLVFDADGDTDIRPGGLDDEIELYTKNIRRLFVDQYRFEFSHRMRIADAKTLGFGTGGAGFGDVQMLWDTAETTDSFKFTTWGGAFLFSDGNDISVNRYGATPPPALSIAVRAAGTTILHRVELGHDGADGFLNSKTGNLIIGGFLQLAQGARLIFDTDEDSWIECYGDDTMGFYVGGSPRLEIKDAGPSVRDDVTFAWGGATDCLMGWDTAETTDTFKVGLASGAFIIGPDGDWGVDRYGGSPPPFGLSVRADDAIATNRVDVYHDGSKAFIATPDTQMSINVGTSQPLLALSQGLVRSYGSFFLGDDVPIEMGGGNDFHLVWDTAETTDTVKFGIKSGCWVFAHWDWEDSNIYGASPPPALSLAIQAPGFAPLQRIGLGHDTTDAWIDAGAGDLKLKVATNEVISVEAALVNFAQDIQMADAKNFIFNTTTGSQLGEAANQKMGLWGVTPIVQPVHFADAGTTHATSSFGEVNTALDALGTIINSIIQTVLEASGAMASA